MLTDNEIKIIADHFKKKIETIKPLSDAYYYNHLSLCVIEAVWSLGVKYQSVINVVQRYCTKRNLEPYRGKNLCDSSSYPEKTQQESITCFLQYVKEFSFCQLADTVFENCQRTSTRNGILKAEAVVKFAKVLLKYDVNYFQDIGRLENNIAFEGDINAIPGQKSGLSLDYFYMLAGDENRTKADRMIKRFLAVPIRREPNTISVPCAKDALRRLFLVLDDDCIKSVRHLDNIIWDYQRRQTQ